MKSSTSKMSSGWSFAAGTFLGALAVAALLHGSGSSAEAAEKQGHVAVSEAILPNDSISQAECRAVDWVVKAAPAKKETLRASTADSEHRLPGHSELDLQCD
jgi:hypothetical protein